MRRNFLWKGEEPEKECGGHCLINWPTVCTPKDMGGLGILDLERLARALRHRWCWFQWKHNSRLWVGLDIPCDKSDRNLFNASTIVTVDKGNKDSFWHSSWVNGAAPKNLAPSLFRKSRRKNFTVQQALNNNFWINQVCPYIRMLSLGSMQVYGNRSVYLIAIQIVMIRLFGDGCQMGIIQLRVHIASSLLGRQEDNPLSQFGRQRRNLNVNSLHGFCCTERY